MDILEKIFGNAGKVKIMRLFIFNPGAHFDLVQIAERTKTNLQTARLNLKLLHDINLVKVKTFAREEKNPEKRGNGRKQPLRKRVRGWTLNENFPYLTALQGFLVQASPLQDRLIVRKFGRTGKIKLLIIAGVFIQEKDSRVDILLVGDNLRRNAIDSTVKDMEAELGRDLTYSVFETKDFNYRLGIYDKLIRDILDYPHKKLVNRLAI